MLFAFASALVISSAVAALQSYWHCRNGRAVKGVRLRATECQCRPHRRTRRSRRLTLEQRNLQGFRTTTDHDILNTEMQYRRDPIPTPIANSHLASRCVTGTG